MDVISNKIKKNVFHSFSPCQLICLIDEFDGLSAIVGIYTYIYIIYIYFYHLIE